jgi:hypothetical protein
MTSSQLALTFVVVMVPAAVIAKFVILRRSGPLSWRDQVPLLVGAVLIVSSAVAITAAGTITQQIIPPLIIIGTGLLLASRDWRATPGSVDLRPLGKVAIVGGTLLLVRALLLVSGG